MSEVRFYTPTTIHNQAWLSRVRTACLMVAGNDESLVRATTLSQRFPGLDAVEGRQLALTASHLAHEYDLVAELEVEAETICVRLSRREPGFDTPSSFEPELEEPVGVASLPPEGDGANLAPLATEAIR